MKTITGIFTLSITALISLQVAAHPGETDEYGCHRNKSSGKFHCNHQTTQTSQQKPEQLKKQETSDSPSDQSHASNVLIEQLRNRKTNTLTQNMTQQDADFYLQHRSLDKLKRAADAKKRGDLKWAEYLVSDAENLAIRIKDAGIFVSFLRDLKLFYSDYTNFAAKLDSESKSATSEDQFFRAENRDGLYVLKRNGKTYITDKTSARDKSIKIDTSLKERLIIKKHGEVIAFDFFD